MPPRRNEFDALRAAHVEALHDADQQARDTLAEVREAARVAVEAANAGRDTDRPTTGGLLVSGVKTAVNAMTNGA